MYCIAVSSNALHDGVVHASGELIRCRNLIEVRVSITTRFCAVVALSLFDLKKRGFLSELHLAGTNGKKLPEIRAHVHKAIGQQYFASEYDLSLKTYPADDAVDPEAYRAALAIMPKGSGVTVFTPDDTHYQIALDCVKAGMHVLVTKPVVKTLAQHIELAKAAAEAGVLVAVEVHKRWDPIYTDAKDRWVTLMSVATM